MSQDRDQLQQHTVEATPSLNTDVAPGRGSASAQLAAPANPITSPLLRKIMRKGRDDNGVADNAESAVAAAAGSSGAPLPETVQRKFEGSLGADLSSVRVHTGAKSEASAEAVGAKAYTVGQDIHFGAGQYDPSSEGGQHLLAHEVAHTVQQSGGSPTRQNKLEVSAPHDAAEHEADRAADAMVSGAPATIASAPQTAARKVFRDKEKAPGETAGANPKFNFETPELKIASREVSYIKFDCGAKVKGSGEIMEDDGHDHGKKNDVTGGVSGSPKGVGLKREQTIAEQQLIGEMGLWVFESEKLKEKWSFEITSEKANISIGAELQFRHEKYHWLKATGECAFNLVDIKWKDLAEGKAKIMSLTVFAGSIAGEGSAFIEQINRHVKLKLAGEIKITASPAWKKIAAKCAEEVAKKGAQAAAETGATAGAGAGAGGAGAGAGAGAGSAGAGAGSTATVSTGTAVGAGAGASAESVAMVSTATVAGEVALLTLPFAAAALMAYGAWQTEKNIKASKAAIDMGLKMRNEIKSYVKNYVATLSGGSGTGKGHLDAEAKVFAYMAASNKERADACTDLMQKNGGKDKIAGEIIAKAREESFNKGVAMFEDKWKDEFGLVEKIGDTWGMRGVFRKDFHGMLYADE